MHTDHMERPVCLITGASSGIGAAIAHKLAATHDLVLVARREERLQQLAVECGDQAEVVCLPCDVSETDETAIVSTVLERFGRCDAIVLNAGLFFTGSAEEITVEQQRAMLALNLEHPMRLTAAALPALRKQQGVIVGISSIAAESAFPGCGLYAASKAGLEGYLRSVREEEREHQVRVSICAPGPTNTEIWPEGYALRSQ